MNSIDMWEVLTDLKPEIVSKICKIIIFGENGSEVIFSTRDGKVYGFGDNCFGELGFGHKNRVKEPKIIVELNDKQVIDFSYGFDYVLGKTITGKLYSWGENRWGQLGIGTNTSDYRPKLIDSISDEFVTDMSCGYYHSLVLTADHQLYGFGRNADGEIGCGNTTNQWKAIKVFGLNKQTVISIACGGRHSLALTQTGIVYGWGCNDWGQLGIGNQSKLITCIPREIVVSNGLSFKRIACGAAHSLILSDSGDVYAFGWNTYASFGTNNTSDSCVAIKVSEISGVTDIASNFCMNISMAKLKDSKCVVWGQCLSGNTIKPIETQLITFNDVILKYSEIKITFKPIECSPTMTDIACDENTYHFNDKNLSDIVFKIGKQEIFVNKLILKQNSNYFRNKYSVKTTEISVSSDESFDGIEYVEVIDDYRYEVFYSYLKYLYTDCVEIENQYLDQLLILSIDHKEEELIIQCSERIFSLDNNWISFENSVKLLKHSIDKNMTELKDKCVERIKSMTTIDNICSVYEVSVEYGLTDLENDCFEKSQKFF